MIQWVMKRLKWFRKYISGDWYLTDAEWFISVWPVSFFIQIHFNYESFVSYSVKIFVILVLNHSWNDSIYYHNQLQLNDSFTVSTSRVTHFNLTLHKLINSVYHDSLQLWIFRKEFTASLNSQVSEWFISVWFWFLMNDLIYYHDSRHWFRKQISACPKQIIICFESLNFDSLGNNLGFWFFGNLFDSILILGNDSVHYKLSKFTTFQFYYIIIIFLMKWFNQVMKSQMSQWFNFDSIWKFNWIWF